MRWPRVKLHPDDAEDSVPVSARMRWGWTVGFEVLLVVIMLSSTASWVVRVVVIVGGTVLVASLNAHWKAYGMPRDGAP